MQIAQNGVALPDLTKNFDFHLSCANPCGLIVRFIPSLISRLDKILIPTRHGIFNSPTFSTGSGQLSFRIRGPGHRRFVFSKWPPPEARVREWFDKRRGKSGHMPRISHHFPLSAFVYGSKNGVKQQHIFTLIQESLKIFCLILRRQLDHGKQ